jgi:hypothetical protein
MPEGKTSRNGIIYCYAYRGGSKYHDRWIDKSLCNNYANETGTPALKRKALSLAGGAKWAESRFLSSRKGGHQVKKHRGQGEQLPQ